MLTEKIKSKFQIRPENLGPYIYPLVKFIHATQTEFVIALDTGARLTGFAVLVLHQQLHGGFPTHDKGITYCRVSHNFSDELNRQQLDQHVQKMMALYAFPTVLVIDDWVNTGRTQKSVKRIFDDLSGGKVHTSFGVMRELFTNVADVRGSSFNVARTYWRHNADLIGITYKENQPLVVRTAQSRELRKQIAAEMRAFGSSIKHHGC